MSGRSPIDDVDIDMEKLTKLEKMIIRVDADIQKRAKDQNKLQFVETLKKTHDIYQLILGELHFQLTELKLDKFGNIIQKIFLGENTLLNVLLKMKANIEFNPNQLLENLEELGKKGRRRNSSTQIPKEEIQSPIKIETKQKINNKLKQPIQRLQQDYIPKVFADKGTDTTLDLQDARRISNIYKKQDELDEIRKEIDDSAKEMENFLKDRKFTNLDAEKSKAEQSLKSMLKDLSIKKRRAEQSEREAQSLLVDPAQEAQIKAKQAANAALIFGTPPGHILRDGKLIQIFNQQIQTERDPLIDKYDKLNNEMKAKALKMAELEKKMKEIQRDADIFKEQNKKLNEKISEMTYIQRKREEEAKKEKKENKVVMNEKDKEKFKALLEDNIRMKLKLKELVDEIKQIELENKNNIKKFKDFIMNSNLTDEQKRMLLGKVDELFTLDLSKRLNLKELEHMSKIDNEMLKDAFFKSVIGDTVGLIKKIKQEEKEKKAMRASPNYDPDFDPNLLEDGQKIITRKVKKKIRRLNSKGEWVEEEIEVEEECVVDKYGNVLRSREKPKEGVVTDPAMLAFINQHGGLAIGGSKYVLPQKPGKPMAKNGQPIKEGEWFIDQNGNKVRMTKNAKGEEEYEIMEEYIDEFGNKQYRVKKMVVGKDKDGNEIITESYIDPKTGKLVTVQKKVYKDKNGNEVIEEVTTDEFGNKITKRTRVLKDKDGNEYIEEQIIDEFGNKIIVRKKKMKDEFGNDIWVTETINADGTRTIVTERIGKNGEKIITEERIDKNGKKTITEKIITIGKDGKPIITEVTYDEKGNKIVKNIKQEIDKDGNAVTVEETVDEFGNKITKKTKIITDKDGNKIKVEEIIGADGKKITKYTREIVDADGNIVTIEETVDEFGNKITKKTKRMFDKDGNEIIEEEIIDANGNRIIIRKKINKDGTVEEERYNPLTGERVIIKKRIDENGREIIEETRIDKDGNAVTTTKVITTDKFGNKIVTESYIDPKTGKLVTVTKKITRDKDGNEIIEETRVDANGNVINVKRKVYKDKDGNEVVEETITGADGKKYTVRTKVYRDADGNEIIEEEMIDEFGNRIITRRKKDKDGREIIETIKIDKDGKKTITQKIINKDGTVEETVIDSNGKVTKTKYRQGYDDKQTQTQTPTQSDLEHLLIQLGCKVEEAPVIANAIMKYIRNGEPFIIGNEDLAKLKDLQGKHNGNMESLKEQRKREMEELRKKREEERLRKQQELLEQKQAKLNRKNKDEEDEDNLDVIDQDMTEEQQLQALYKRMKEKGGMMGELLRNIRNQLGKDGDDDINFDDFKEYFNKYKQVHSKCGENCPHLKRFYARLGYIQSKYKRKFLKMKDTRINAFSNKQNQDKLPQIHNKGSQDLYKSNSSLNVTKSGIREYSNSVVNSTTQSQVIKSQFAQQNSQVIEKSNYSSVQQQQQQQQYQDEFKGEGQDELEGDYYESENDEMDQNQYQAEEEEQQ